MCFYIYLLLVVYIVQAVHMGRPFRDRHITQNSTIVKYAKCSNVAKGKVFDVEVHAGDFNHIFVRLMENSWLVHAARR